MDEEEPTLPNPIRANSIGTALGETDRNPVRKRVRDSSPAPAFSSDPALFSSDDDPSADNYTTKRQKKKYRGPWFSQQPASDPCSESHDTQLPKGKKRTLKRQFDSGVWMGSDSTEGDDDTNQGPPPIAGSFKHTNPWLNRNTASIPESTLHSHVVRGLVGLKCRSPEDLAADYIHKCLEDGTEAINLSYVQSSQLSQSWEASRSKLQRLTFALSNRSRNLTELANETIEPLATFTCTQRIAGGVRFESLVPDLQVYLGSNNLTMLPGALFNLDRLTVLSLRHNDLQEIPPGIGKLSSLKELNVSQNSLNYLPYEILELVSENGCLRNFQIHPNPFFEPQDLNTQAEQAPEDAALDTPVLQPLRAGNTVPINTNRGSNETPRSWSSKWHVSFKFRTETRFRDVNGVHIVKGPAFPTDSPRETSLLPSSALTSSNLIPIAAAHDLPIPPVPRGSHLSRAPSLLEVALRACSKTRELPYLDQYLPKDRPDHLPELLAKAGMSKESGGSQCTICGRAFIIPRTEWIEWWEIAKATEKKTTTSAASPLRHWENQRSKVESMVPLIRRGCSWLCVPGKPETDQEFDEFVDDGERGVNLD